MQSRFFRGLALFAVAGLLIGGPGIAAASPPDGGRLPPVATKSADGAPTADELPNPQEEKRRALREEALKLVLSGERKVQRINGVDVVKVGKKLAPLTRAEQARVRAGQRVARRMVDQYVELSRKQTDQIFVVLAEFGNERDPRFPDRDTDPTTAGPTVFDGPLHNAIPQPNRAVDNSTVWQADYSADYYRNLYFGENAGAQSLKQYYERQSSGRYSVDGMVTDWVKVRYNEARYGRSDDRSGTDPNVCASNVCSTTWDLLRDGVNQWVADQKAKGQTDAQLAAMLATFDQQDRYDYDADGNFRERDGYIDHFQVVHSGGDQADGDPYQGEDAIWSHRWKAYQCATPTGCPGPSINPDGGTQIGTTGFWVADYTIQPENGGRSVFAHEYAHDLGLPDLYNTAGGGDNGVDWWSLMAQSRAKARNDVGIGTRAADLGAWEKLQLGWLDYEIRAAGDTETLELGPHEYNSSKPQAVVVVLPQKTVTVPLVPPVAGTKQWYSGAGDDYNATLTRQVSVPAGSSQLSFQANYNIEDCGPDPCDYAYVEVNTGGGFTPIAGNITKAAEGNGIDGESEGWDLATFDMSAYAGQSVGLRFRYTTDGAAQGQDPDRASGLFVDDIKLTAGTTTVFTDGAESGNNGWTPDKFAIVGATSSYLADHYYLASHRSYVSYDRYLRTGPYNFGFSPAQPDKVEFFPYQNGLLINYWDTSYADNNTSEHPGGGLILPIDANPAPIYKLTPGPWRGRIQVYDAPFSRQRSDSFTLHSGGRASYIRGQAAQPLFDDSRSYFDQRLENADVHVGVKVPNAGVTMRVVQQGATSMRVQLGYKEPAAAQPAAQR